MSTQALAIHATGMVTGVGLDTASSCAAIRAAIDNFQETRFMDSGGEWIQGCEVPLEQPWRGTRKLAKMLAMALQECATEAGIKLEDVPVLICVAEKERPGRVENLGNRVFFETQQELDIRFHEQSNIVQHGRVGGLVAMLQARKMIYEQGATQVIIAGVDSLLNAPAINAYEEQDRILTSQNSNGFIPGEAASAVAVSKPADQPEPQLMCLGLGFGQEEATIDSEEPLRAEGLSQAVANAFREAKKSMNDMDFRIVDVTGEQYWFKETSLVLSRFLRVHKEGFPLWNPTDCVGEVGAAFHGVALGYAKMAYKKGFDDGNNLLIHNSNDDGRRGAAVLNYLRER